MNENIDLTKILEGCPKGTKFYHVVFGDVSLLDIRADFVYPIRFTASDNCCYAVSPAGISNIYYKGECVLFPSKGQRDWSKFERFWDKPKVEKFDPKTFQPFDKVLVKRGDESYYVWFPDFVSLPPNDVDKTVFCMNTDDVVMAIPYNEETKHLVDTNEEAPEFYRYWED